MDTQDTQTFFLPDYQSLTYDVKGSGEDAIVQVMLTNLNNNKHAAIGTYKFNFADSTTSLQSGGDIDSAFQQVEGFPQEETTAATEAPTEPTNDHQPGVNGDYDINGNWVPYNAGSNGDWRNGSWEWYQPEVNGYWGNDGLWHWGQRPTEQPSEQGQEW